MRTVYVVYLDEHDQEQTTEIVVDDTGLDEEDFQGGPGQDLVEQLWREKCPTGQLQWLELECQE